MSNLFFHSGGKEYHVSKEGYISYDGLTPSAGWIFLGVRHVKRNEFVALEDLTPEKMESMTWRYKNGNPQYTVIDWDHGTMRMWGNTRYHGIRYIGFEKD